MADANATCHPYRQGIDDIEKNRHRAYSKICQNTNRKGWNVCSEAMMGNSLQSLNVRLTYVLSKCLWMDAIGEANGKQR